MLHRRYENEKKNITKKIKVIKIEIFPFEENSKKEEIRKAARLIPERMENSIITLLGIQFL